MFELERNLRNWLEEDMPFGDITSDYIFDDTMTGTGELIAKEEGVICGTQIFAKIYELIDRAVEIEFSVNEGDRVSVGDVIGVVNGPMAGVLKGERLGLNLMQRLSGIATMSATFSDLVKDLPTVIVDTRKTTPGLRSLEKYAVRVGGCTNHRYSLSDAVMIKDNHISGAGGIAEAVTLVREHIPHTVKVEVEAETLTEVQSCIDAGADIIMLDNMDNDMTREAVGMIRKAGKGITIEASGNMTMDRIRGVAETGVDVISIGALTHSVKAMDISLKFAK